MNDHIAMILVVHNDFTHLSCCHWVTVWGLQSAVSLPLHAANISIHTLSHSKHGMSKDWVCRILMQGNGWQYLLWLRDRKMSFTVDTHLRGTCLLSAFIRLPVILVSFLLCKKIFWLAELKEHCLLYVTFLQIKVVFVSLIIFSFS